MRWEAAPTAAILSLNPSSPGVLTGSGQWLTTVSSTSLTQYQWAIFASNNVAYGSWVVEPLTAGTTTNSASLSVTFQATGDYLVVTEVGNPTVYAKSSSVELSPVPVTIYFSPDQPGSINSDLINGASWSTTVETSGLTAVQYAVFDMLGELRGNWATLTLTGNSTALTVEFQATGDYLEATAEGIIAQSGAVTIVQHLAAGSADISLATTGDVTVVDHAIGELQVAVTVAGVSEATYTATAAASLQLATTGTAAEVILATGLFAFPLDVAAASTINMSAAGVLLMPDPASPGTASALYAATGGPALALAPAGAATAFQAAAGVLTLAEITPAATADAVYAASGELTLADISALSTTTIDYTTSGVLEITFTTPGQLFAQVDATGAIAIGALSDAGTAVDIDTALGNAALSVAATGTSTHRNAAVGSGEVYLYTSGSINSYISAAGTVELSLAPQGTGGAVVYAVGSVSLQGISTLLESVTDSSGETITDSGGEVLYLDSGSAAISIYTATGSLELTYAPTGVSANIAIGHVTLSLSTGAHAVISLLASGTISVVEEPAGLAATTNVATGSVKPLVLIEAGDVSNGAVGHVSIGTLEVAGDIYAAGIGVATLQTILVSGTATAKNSAKGELTLALSVPGTSTSSQTMTLVPAGPGTLNPGQTWSTEVVTTPPLQGTTTTTTTSGSTTSPTSATHSLLIVQGQSNADFMTNSFSGSNYSFPNFGTIQMTQAAVELLTGIPCVLMASTSIPTQPAPDPSGGLTIYSGEPTYDSTSSNGTQLWLNGYGTGSNPAAWPLGTFGTWFQNYINYWVNASSAQGNGKFTAAGPNDPVILLRFHSEYDTQKTGTDLSYYAAANMSFMERAFGWTGVSKANFAVGYSMPGFAMSTNSSALSTVRAAWVADINGTSGATYNAFWASGNNYDCYDHGDLSHMDPSGDWVCALRLAHGISKWMFENGFSKNDLSLLPTGGPRITSFSVVNTNQLQVNVVHDKGSDLIVPAATTSLTLNTAFYNNANQTSNLQAFTVSDGNGARTVTGMSYGGPNYFILTLDQAPSGTITLDYLLYNNFYGPNNLITDNWHTTSISKPQWMVDFLFAYCPGLTMPVEKLDQPIVGAGTVLTPADAPTGPVPALTTTPNSGAPATVVAGGASILGTNSWAYGYYAPGTQAIAIAGGTTGASWTQYAYNNTIKNGPNGIAFNAGSQKVPSNATIGISWSNGDYLVIKDSSNSNINTQTDPYYDRSSTPAAIGVTDVYTFNTVVYPDGDKPVVLTGTGGTGGTVTTTNPAQIVYQVFTQGGTAEGTPNTIDLSNGTVDISGIAFVNTGDYLHVNAVGSNLFVNSTGVTINTASNFTIGLNPASPGTLIQNVSQGGGALWKPVATVANSTSATPTYVQNSYATPQGATVTVSASFAGAQTAGNTNLVFIGWNDDTATISSVADSAGNTYTLESSPQTYTGTNPLTQAIYACVGIKAASSNSITVTFAGSGANTPDLRIVEYSGILSLDVAASASGSSATAAVGLTTTAANDLVIAGVMTATNVASQSTGATLRVVTSPDGDSVEDEAVATAGTATIGANLGSSGSWVINAVAMKTSTSSGGALPVSLNYWVEHSNGTTGATLNAALVSNSATLFAMFGNTGDVLVVSDPTNAVVTKSGSVTIAPPSSSLNTAGTGASPVSMAGWQLVMDSEFTTQTAFDSNWSIVGGYLNQGTTYMQTDTSPWTFDPTNGLGGKVWNNGTEWLSGSIMSGAVDHAGFWQSYNGKGGLPLRVETKFYYPDANGLGAYCLLWPYTDKWTSELDMIETPQSSGTFSNAFQFTWHDPTGAAGGGTPDTSQEAYYPIVNRSQWHVLTVEYGNPGIRLWIDGAEQLLPGQPGFGGSNLQPGGWWSESGAEYDAWDAGKYQPVDPMTVGIAGLEFNGGAFGGPPSSTSATYNFYHSYVRQWVPNTNSEGGVGGSLDNPGPLGTASSPLATAQAFVAGLTCGVQVPRNSTPNLDYNGSPISSSTAYWSYLVSLGVSHVGFMYPSNATGVSDASGGAGGDDQQTTPSTSDNVWLTLIACAQYAQQAGLKTIIRVMDNLTPSYWGSNQTTWLTTACNYIKNNTTLKPNMTLVVPHGELAYSTNTYCNPIIIQATQTARAVLPQSGGWILGVGGAYWQGVTGNAGDKGNILLATSSIGELAGDVPRAIVTLAGGGYDLQCVYMIDNYGGTSGGGGGAQSYWATVAGYMSAFQQHYNSTVGGNVPMIIHECGPYDTSWSSPNSWAGFYSAAAAGGGQYCMTFWDVSNDDGALYMNNSLGYPGDAALPSANASDLQTACATVKSASYYGNGAIR